MTPIHVGSQWADDPRQLSLRPFEGTPADFEALAVVRNATLKATTLPEDYRDMSADEMRRFYSSSGFDMAGNAWLMRYAEEPVAAAVVYPAASFPDRMPGNFDMYVVPGYWRHGLGSRLLAHLEQAAAARGHRVLETTIAAEDEQSSQFLQRHGLKVVGHSLHFVRPSMDDLPQVYNVLVGEMSVVGPRPEQPAYVQEFARRIHRYIFRHREKAGITGWAQVNGLRGDSSIELRTKMDLYYVEHWSLLFDLKIIVRTIVAMFRGKNAY